MVTIDGYDIDVAVREEHAYQNEVTEHPVEEGADIVDHVRRKPAQVTLEGIVSDTPFGLVAEKRTGTTLPSREAYDRLVAIDTARLPVTIVTSLRTYTDMVLQSLTVPRDAKTGDALMFTAVFKQVRIVVNERVLVEVPRVKGKVNRGNKPATPAPTAPDNRSAALKLKDGGADLLGKFLE